MKNLELNKIFGAVLLVAFVIVFSQNFVDHFYEHVSSSKEERKEFTRGKLSQKISMRALVPDDEFGEKFADEVYGFMKGTRYFPQIRKIPKETFPWTSEFTLYGKDKIAMFKLIKNNFAHSHNFYGDSANYFKQKGTKLSQNSPYVHTRPKRRVD